MRTFIAGLLTVVALAGFGCTSSSAVPIPEASVAFDSTVMLSVGRSLTFEDELSVTLTQINDSRCAEGVVCIWQGELSPVVRLSGGTLDGDVTVTLGTERTKIATAGSYSVRLMDATETTATFVVTVTGR